jgi:hypothetical protein
LCAQNRRFLYFAVQKVSTRTPNSWYRAWGVVESGEKGNQGEYRFPCPAVMLLGVHHSENGSFSGCGTKIINHFSGWENLFFSTMKTPIIRKKIVAAAFVLASLISLIPPQEANAAETNCVTGFGICEASVAVLVKPSGDAEVTITVKIGVWQEVPPPTP